MALNTTPEIYRTVNEYRRIVHDEMLRFNWKYESKLFGFEIIARSGKENEEPDSASVVPNRE